MGQNSNILCKTRSAHENTTLIPTLDITKKQQNCTNTKEKRHKRSLGTATAKPQEIQHMTAEYDTEAVGTAAVEPQKNRHMNQHEPKYSLAAQALKRIGTNADCRKHQMIISNEQGTYKTPVINRYVTSRSKHTKFIRIYTKH